MEVLKSSASLTETLTCHTDAEAAGSRRRQEGDSSPGSCGTYGRAERGGHGGRGQAVV